MLIGLDGIPLTELKTGVGHYTLELARSLALSAPGIEFELVYPSTFKAPEELDVAASSPTELPRNLRSVRVEVGALTRHWWSLGLPRYLSRAALKYDLFHGTNFDVPLWGGATTVLTLHDLSALIHARTHTTRAAFRARRRLPLMIRRADAIITPTEAVRTEACSRMGVDAELVFAVHEAARRVFRPADPLEALDARRRLGVGAEFLLAVGTIEPRKNLSTLLRAFESLVRAEPRRDLQLVVAGKPGWLNREFFSEVNASEARGRVRFTGYLPDEDLRALYSSCRAFVFPSLYEGFGLPVLEAMACGAPVVCSHIRALEETAGDAALFFEPRDAEALARALASLLDDEEARRRLSSAGMRRAAEFTWERTARLTLDVYDAALGRARR